MTPVMLSFFAAVNVRVSRPPIPITPVCVAPFVIAPSAGGAVILSARMFEELLADLDRADVRFVVVGGLAVVIQGFARLTADVDLVIDLDAANVRRALDALLARGLRPLLPVTAMDFADEAIRREWVETRNLEVFSMRDPANPLLVVDLFAREPIPFEELWSRADTVTLGGRTIRVASIEDLIRMKRSAGRPQDAVDIQRLEEIARRRHGR